MLIMTACLTIQIGNFQHFDFLVDKKNKKTTTTSVANLEKKDGPEIRSWQNSVRELTWCTLNAVPRPGVQTGLTGWITSPADIALIVRVVVHRAVRHARLGFGSQEFVVVAREAHVGTSPGACLTGFVASLTVSIGIWWRKKIVIQGVIQNQP